METIKLVVPGVPIVKKNTKKMALYRTDKHGRKIPLDRPATYYSTAYTEWAKGAIQKCINLRRELENKGIPMPIQDQINLKCHFYFDRNTVVDLSNLYEGIQDVLAGNAGVYEKSIDKKYYQIIEDDSVRFIGSHDGSRFMFDHINPRTEVFLEPFKM